VPAGKPPFVRCQCGRLHRSWNPYKTCTACVRESKSDHARQVNEQAKERERRRLRPTPAELELDRAKLAAIHERWLARQSLDHPWRVARERGAA